MLTIAQLTAYIQAATLLTTFAKVTVAEIKAMFGANQNIPAEQLDLILEAVEQDARRRKALADAESGRT